MSPADYDEDFEASDAEKDDYEDDFDDGDKDQSEHSARSPAQSSRRSRSKSPVNSDGEDKTAREVIMTVRGKRGFGSDVLMCSKD